MEFVNFFGIVIMLLIMIPNIIFAIKCKDGFVNKYQNKFVINCEQIFRYCCFALMIVNLPFLYIGFWFEYAKLIYLIVNLILILSYCLGWIIFWNKTNLARSLVLSILPSVIFIFSGILSLYIPLIVCGVFFAFCHITVSVKNT